MHKLRRVLSILLLPLFVHIDFRNLTACQQAHQDTLDAAPTETALRALNEARAAVVAILDRLRSLMPATPSSVSASVSAPSAPAQESPTVAAISSSAAVVPGATDARRFCARVRVEQCTLCERVLAITDRGAQNASSASASGSSGATNVQSLIARVESLRIKVAALDGGAVDKAVRNNL